MANTQIPKKKKTCTTPPPPPPSPVGPVERRDAAEALKALIVALRGIPEPKYRADGCDITVARGAAVVSLDVHAGTSVLSAARVVRCAEADARPWAFDDLISRAVETNSVPFLVREVPARITAVRERSAEVARIAGRGHVVTESTSAGGAVQAGCVVDQRWFFFSFSFYLYCVYYWVLLLVVLLLLGKKH
jgi:hypothetical protein